jgi:hypothetical protein
MNGERDYVSKHQYSQAGTQEISAIFHAFSWVPDSCFAPSTSSGLGDDAGSKISSVDDCKGYQPLRLTFTD